MLNKKPTRILAISPGTRGMGVAVLEEGRLVYFGVKALRQGKLSDRVIKRGVHIIEKLMDEYDPHILAIEKTLYAGSRRSSILHGFCKKTKGIAKDRGIHVYNGLPSVVRKTICGEGSSTKRETAKTIANIYPELMKYLTDQKSYNQQQREHYWMSVFDAVGLGLVCYRKDGKI
jgi:Holliday junction resolvasome RuvABC endonuclease subunit